MTHTITFDPDRYEVHLDEATHIYTVTAWCGDEIVWSEEKPGVTTILKDAGVVSCYGVDDYYRDRGTLVHKYCVLYAQQWLEWTQVREDCLPYVQSFASIVWELGLSYVSAEQPCYDPEYDVCGTFDLIMMRDGKRILVELKTGRFPMWGGLQIAAYERMVEVDDVMGVSLELGKVYVKAPDYRVNHDVWEQINTGWFVYEKWKQDRKRRRMIVLKEAA